MYKDYGIFYMLKYKLTWLVDEVIVSLNTDNPDEFTDIRYEGEQYLIDGIRNWLEHEFGLYGHLIGDRCRFYAHSLDFVCTVFEA